MSFHPERTRTAKNAANAALLKIEIDKLMMTRRAALAMAGLFPAYADESLALFDGKTFAGWTLGDGAEVIHSWTIEDGAIATVSDTRGRSDLLCTKALRSFELTFEFRLSRGSNTGLKYFIQHTLRYLYPGSTLTGSYGAIGLEFQLADDSSPELLEAGKETRRAVRHSSRAAAVDLHRGRMHCRAGVPGDGFGSREIERRDLVMRIEILE